MSSGAGGRPAAHRSAATSPARPDIADSQRAPGISPRRRARCGARERLGRVEPTMPSAPTIGWRATIDSGAVIVTAMALALDGAIRLRQRSSLGSPSRMARLDVRGGTGPELRRFGCCAGVRRGCNGRTVDLVRSPSISPQTLEAPLTGVSAVILEVDRRVRRRGCDGATAWSPRVGRGAVTGTSRPTGRSKVGVIASKTFYVLVGLATIGAIRGCACWLDLLHQPESVAIARQRRRAGTTATPGSSSGCLGGCPGRLQSKSDPASW